MTPSPGSADRSETRVGGMGAARSDVGARLQRSRRGPLGPDSRDRRRGSNQSGGPLVPHGGPMHYVPIPPRPDAV